MKLTRLVALLLTVHVSALAGGAGGPAASPGRCLPGFVQPSPAALMQALASAQARWRATGIRSYGFTLDQISQPVRYPRVRIEVSGQAVQVTALEPGIPSASARKSSVEGLYRSVLDSIAFARSEPCAEVKVSYASDGHPISFSLAQINPNIADGGVSWTVSDFRRR